MRPDPRNTLKPKGLLMLFVAAAIALLGIVRFVRTYREARI